MLGIVFLIFHGNIFKLPRLILFLLVIISLVTKPNVLLYTSLCPNCFGSEFCEPIAKGDVQFYWFSKFLLILHPKLTKSVFFGKLNNSRDIVLKSMTRRGEIPVKHYESVGRELFDSIIRDNTFTNDDKIQNVVLCPNVRSLHVLFDSVDANLTNLIHNRNLWLDTQISIEPLLLKFLSSVKGMPVPGYCGACGDVIVKEFKGKALNNYYNHNWMTRAFLSVQVLAMAETFTFHHEFLSFYFTDLSSDNIVVDSTGMVYLTDLDHVIIAERRLNYSGDLTRKNIVYKSTVVDPIKLAVIPSDVCKYPVSDHNYFAVCRHILLYSEEVKQGLLSDVPDEIEKHQNLRKLLEECAQPEKYDSRIDAGRVLRNTLNEAISNFEWKESS